MMTEVGTNGETTLSRLNLSGCIGHLTYIWLNSYYCVLFSGRASIMVRIKI